MAKALRSLFLAISLVCGCAPPPAPPATSSTPTAPAKAPAADGARKRGRDLGIVIGTLKPGTFNAITDVPGVRVGHTTLNSGEGRSAIRTGVTVIVPTSDDYWHSKLPAAFFALNGNGEMTGIHYLKEFGILETPIIFTNTLSVGSALDGATRYMLQRFPQIGADESPVTPVVGECDDGTLNDARGLHVHPEHVIAAAEAASTGPVLEGAVGGGTGMICFEFKCGIGTSSRVLPAEEGGYHVGAIVQANFGSREELRIDGVPVGRELMDIPSPYRVTEGSLLVVVATDAPLTARQLERVARRVSLAVGRTGTVSRDGSGDLFLAYSTGNRIPDKGERTHPLVEMQDSALNPLFGGAEEAVEEAILDALTTAQTTVGREGHTAHAIPLDRLRDIMRKYGRLREP